MKDELIQRIKTGGQGYQFVQAMQELSLKAAEGDRDAMDALREMLEECKDMAFWNRNSRYCSAVVHAVGHSATLRSMKLLIDFARALPPGASYGVVELVSSILPSFRRIIMGPIQELITENPEGPARAIGIQTLCNLYLENLLQGEQIRFLEDVLKNFDSDDYLTQHVADLVRLEMAYKEKEAEADLQAVLKGFLVEDGSSSG